jgi:hypothetical protein
MSQRPAWMILEANGSAAIRPAGHRARGAESPGIPDAPDIPGGLRGESNRGVTRCPINVPRHARTRKMRRHRRDMQSALTITCATQSNSCSRI